MFKNDFPITRIIGSGITSIGVFFLSILFDNLNRPYRNNGPLRDEEWILLVLGVTIILCGIGFIAKLKWVRTLLTLSLFGFVCFMGFIGLKEFLRVDGYERLLFFGGGVMMVTIFISLGLLFYNKKLNDEFGDTDATEDWNDVLDLE